MSNVKLLMFIIREESNQTNTNKIYLQKEILTNESD